HPDPHRDLRHQSDWRRTAEQRAPVGRGAVERMVERCRAVWRRMARRRIWRWRRRWVWWRIRRVWRRKQRRRRRRSELVTLEGRTGSATKTRIIRNKKSIFVLSWFRGQHSELQI